ncbi:hypothetical protein KCU67_g77, partial [Aureobasidium melanogenum]
LNQSINQSINHGGEGTLFILEFAACHGASLAGAISVIVKTCAVDFSFGKANRHDHVLLMRHEDLRANKSLDID